MPRDKRKKRNEKEEGLVGSAACWAQEAYASSGWVMEKMEMEEKEAPRAAKASKKRLYGRLPV